MTLPLILVLGTADWDQAIATNQHYMSRELAKEFDVLFVESLGLRRPEFSRRDLSRIWQRVSGRRGSHPMPLRARPERLTVISPVVLPWHRGIASWLNARRLRRALAAWLQHTGPRVLWCYSPVAYDLHKSADYAFYHCVDLIGQFPGISAELIDSAEETIAAAGVESAGSSPVVVQHLRERGFKDPIYWPNVADVEPVAALSRSVAAEDRVGRAVFAGNLSANKVDFRYLHAVLDVGYELNLAGPISEGGGSAGEEVAALVERGAKYHGLKTLEGLAEIYAGASVGLIPYHLNAYTRGVSPLKTFEYLAAGLVVVSTPIPAVEPLDDDVFVCDSIERFSDTLMTLRREAGPDDLSRRARIADAHSWTLRGVEGREVVRSAVATELA